jgi:CPA1 family monovalent cation:H+ antiporter
VGLAISLPQLAAALPWIAWGVMGALVGRAVVVYGLLGAAWRIRGPAGIPAQERKGWLHVLNWSGLRGAVAVALALSLPADVPERVRLQEITFGIVLFTLLVQGMTIEPLIRRWVGGPQPTGLER